jgi:hypothetical protein
LHITEKPTEYIDFLKITKVPMNIRMELENFYTNSKTYTEFFHLIPKQEKNKIKVKKYYCPTGFNRNMNYLEDIGANVL